MNKILKLLISFCIVLLTSNFALSKESFFEEALKLDSNFADAYGYAAYVHQALYWYGYDRNIKPLKISKEYIDKGLKLDPNSPVLYATRGYYHYWVNRDYTRALEDFIYARDAVPNNAEYIANIGWIERRLGRFDNAIDNFLAGCKGIIPSLEGTDIFIKIYKLLEQKNISEARKVYKKILPSIVFSMQSIDSLTCYGKRICAYRMGVKKIYDRSPSLSPTKFGTDLAKQFADNLGKF